MFPEDDIFVSIQQAFRPASDFYGYLPYPGAKSVSLDMHVYHGFDPYWTNMTEKPNAWPNHLQGACDYIQEVNNSYSRVEIKLDEERGSLGKWVGFI